MAKDNKLVVGQDQKCGALCGFEMERGNLTLVVCKSLLVKLGRSWGGWAVSCLLRRKNNNGRWVV